MTTVAIPKELAGQKNLIAVPRGAYEEFLLWQRQIKSSKTFIPTMREKKALARARKNFSRGKFVTYDQLRHELDFAR